jgi:hypothetical protein
MSVVMVDSDLFHERDDTSLEHLMRMKSLVSASPSDVGKKVGRIGRRGRRFRRLWCTRYARRTFEEERHRDLQDVGDLLQPACADSVGALLVRTTADFEDRSSDRSITRFTAVVSCMSFATGTTGYMC